MLLGGRSANIAQLTSMTSHVFPASSTVIMHQDDNRLPKDWQLSVPLFGGKECIPAPNSISRSYSFNRSGNSPLEYMDLSHGETIKKNERISKFKPNVTELNLRVFSSPNLFPKPLLLPMGRTASYQSLFDLTGEPIQTSKAMFLSNVGMLHFKGVEQERTTTTIGPSQYRFNDINDGMENATAPETIASPLCPEKTKSNKQRKRKGKRSLNEERNVYKRSYFHACESLLTLMMGANQRDYDGSVVSLVRSAPEIPALLTQISACFAGTGMAVLFFAVAWMVNSGGGGPTASEFVSLGVGLGLMWVAWSVIKLRDAIACIVKCSADVAADVGIILNEMYFRCAVLLGLLVLKIG